MTDVGNAKTPEYAGVRIDHPSIVSLVRNCAKEGRPITDAMKLSGMPAEVVNRIYHEAKGDKK